MSKDNNSVKRGSVLSRRLKGIIETRKQIHNPASWLPKKDKAYTILLTSNDEKLPFITLIIQLGRLQLRFLFPKLIEPSKTSVYTDLKGFNRKGWVYKYAPKIYGIGYLPKEKVFHVFHGVNSGNSKGFPKDKLFVWIPVWSRYRLIKHVIIDKNNNTFWENTFLKDRHKQRLIATDTLGGVCPKLRFECVNEDACRVLGSAYIEERVWCKGITIFGRPLFRKSVRSRRLLKVHLQVNRCDEHRKPYSLQYDFTMYPKETIREAIHRFCKSQIFEKDKTLRLYLEYIEPDTK